MATAAEFLAHAQNPDGGWGYRVGGMSFVEPTAAVIMALQADKSLSEVTAESARRRGKAWLLSMQHPDGGWGVGAVDSESGWMTAWALIALAGESVTPEAVERGVDWLLKTQGLVLAEPDLQTRIEQVLSINPSLCGWPWRIGDASWVHPTALAILALILTGNGKSTRVQQGIEFLLDRAVHTGGWNIGDPEMVGEDLSSTVQDSAVALIALKRANTSAQVPQVAKAVAWLRSACDSAATAAELAWGSWALGTWQIPVREIGVRLRTLQQVNGSWQGNPFITAIALVSQYED